MRFGGHQTFSIRDGWLYKGLELLMDTTEAWKLTDDFAMDYLGVGRNMAKSINHWLLATGLAEKATETNEKGKTIIKKDLIPTPLAQIIWNKDPYFLDLNTWWFLHINLIHNESDAASWNWFFNNFSMERFQKEKCVKSLERYEKIHSSRVPSITTLDRDISCLLSSYSVDIPSMKKDPEDEIDCPFQELGLMKSFRHSGFFELNRNSKDICPEVFLYALTLSNPSDSDIKKIDIPFFDMINKQSSPSKVFLLGNEGVFELLLALEAKSSDISIHGLAGERLIQYTNNSPIHWIKRYFEQDSEREAI